MQEHDIAKIRAHDRDALDDLFSRYMQKVYAISFHLCAGDREQARDLAQEALLKAVRTIDSFRGAAAFSTWLYRIIYTTYLDSRKQAGRWAAVFSFLRRARLHDEAGGDGADETPDWDAKKNPLAMLRENQLGMDVRKALQGLPDKQRIVFQLKVLEDMSIKEIAHVLSCAEGTVKSHLFRATRQLQKDLRDWA